MIEQKKRNILKDVHFYANFTIGFFIAILLHFLEFTTFGIKTLDSVFDFFIRHESNIAQEIAFSGNVDSKISSDLLFIDFRLQDYNKWGNPLITPRDEIARQIHIADSNKAKIVITDFIFDYKDCCYPEKDDSLRRVLTRIASNGNNTKVIFPVQIGENKILKPLIYDDIISINKRKLLKAVPLVVASAHDNLVRYAEDFKEYKNNKTDIANYRIMSIPSLVGKIISGSQITDPEMDSTRSKNYRLPPELKQSENGKKKSLEEYAYKRRIRYLLIPPEDSAEVKDGDIPLGQYYTIDNASTANFDNKIVIIGSSNPELTDNHETPVGRMAGMYILGNVINTEIMNLYPAEVPGWIKYLTEIIIILIASYVFLLYEPFKAQLITSILLLIPFGFLNYYLFFKYGIIINILLPTMGISFHRIIGSIENDFSKKHEKH